MAKKCLVVTKDIGGFQAVRPVADLLKQRGHSVSVVAEGLSLAKWEEAGYGVCGGAPMEGALDTKTLIRSDLDPETIIRRIAPDFVLASAGSPIGLELTVCSVAKSLHVPVVVVNDIWGSDQRLKGVMPNVVCTLDQEDTRLAAGYYGPGKVNIVETGSPTFDTFVGQAVPSNHALRNVTSNFQKVVYVLGQDASTTAYLKGVFEAVAGESNTLVIVGFHPKFLPMPEFCMQWLQIVKAAKVPVIWTTNIVTSRQYMWYSDIVVSCYSTGLVEAALMGKLAVSWVSDVGRQKMAAALGGLTQFPLVAYGGACQVSNVEEFNRISTANDEFKEGPDSSVVDRWEGEAQSKDRENLRTKLHIDGHAAERVVQAIHDRIDVSV